MKKFIAILVSAMFATAAFAQAPAPKADGADKADVQVEKADQEKK